MNDKPLSESPSSSTDRLGLRFILFGVFCLFVGTMQGFLQSTPRIRHWIHMTGQAGHLVDPLAHAHINLIGGVVSVVMAMVYYLLPRLSGKKIWSPFLGEMSFFFMVAGVLGFYTVLLTFGILEGNRMLDQGIVYPLARAVYQPYHRIGFVLAALFMGIGHWTFVWNVFATVWSRDNKVVLEGAPTPAKERV
ncbi:MAG: cbb3-type cytochrome c oxidase subunit I [Nitrospirae bacterium]|uniref:Probable cytochrome-c oxidase n=1 Tax=Leptospirillum ferrodiazotrophum TaxID=412449 RepID=C6I0V7_9BACT|nr:MAG: probable cytochrome-c oxidase [Leptospirillum ferrodiazotrophum]MCL5953819.1 cbb3-type cytochrome c oxidase subunit I [Nitrospirota bacterium]